MPTYPPLDAGARSLLDFIGKVESNDNYDVIYGMHPTPVPITTMSLAALMSAQRTWGKQWGSDAAGKYQMMRATLSDLIATTQTPSSEIFSPALQDSLAMVLLVRRGWMRFKSGALSLENFAKQVAMEWASMPVLTSTQGAHRIVAAGETYYAGDRLNRALVTPSAFRAALMSAKALAATPASTSTPVSCPPAS